MSHQDFATRKDRINYLKSLASGNSTLEDLQADVRLLSYEFGDPNKVFRSGSDEVLTRAEAEDLMIKMKGRISWTRYILQEGNETIIETD